MNRTLLILGASGFFGKTILKHLYQRNSFYKKKLIKLLYYLEENQIIKLF
jgi:hypothetical protein